MLSNLMVSIVATLISIAQPQATQRNVELSLPQTECLTEAIYFESRSEGTVGSAAVSYVILNRSALEGKTICEVIHEKSQFSFYRPHAQMRIQEQSAWHESAKIAIETQLGTIANPIGNATFYNTVPVRSWRHVVFIRKIKHHLFYAFPSVATEVPLVSYPYISNASYVQPTPEPENSVISTSSYRYPITKIRYQMHHHVYHHRRHNPPCHRHIHYHRA